jgi:hypothetical protein
MKKISVFIMLGILTGATSCNKFLDINQNPNSASAESATPELLLPQAITYTSGTLNTLNTVGSQVVGHAANAGGYGGFGVNFTYNYTSSFANGIWNSVYDNSTDLKSIIDKTEGKPEYAYYNGVARIMKALNFQFLVDAYNDVPYSDALKGSESLTPKYDDGPSIYKNLAEELDNAIASINAGLASPATSIAMTVQDVMFKGDMVNWKKLANTIKLRLMIRGAGKVTFSNTSFDAAGFLTTDALINPGYTRLSGKQNPKWESWGFTYTGADGNKAWMPNTFVMSYYNGKKLSDPGRGSAIYYQFPSTPTNRLGNIDNVTSSPSGSFWYPSTNRTGSSSGGTTGVLKGPDAGMPVITAAESYFLQAEGVLKGIIATGNVKDLFEKGIAASFSYLYTKPDKTVSGNPAADVAAYLEENEDSRLVNFDLATTPAQKLEAIITQKYIALNFVNSDEAWNEYRRTHYPTIVTTITTDGTLTFASKDSEASRPDKLPTRIPYPTSEGSTNTTNLPKNVSVFTSLIFWALQ